MQEKPIMNPKYFIELKKTKEKSKQQENGIYSLLKNNTIFLLFFLGSLTNPINFYCCRLDGK